MNVSALEKFEDGAVVSACDLLEKGILSKCEHGVKILGEGQPHQEADRSGQCFLRLREGKN